MLCLRLKTTLTIPLEAPCIAPDQLRHLPVVEISKLTAQLGNTKAQLGDFFHVDGDPSDGMIDIDGDCSRVKWIGHAMTHGNIRFHGPCGMHTGSAMSGGRIEIDGDADDWLGAEMSGGVIHVHGKAADHCAAAYPGSRKGMRGGMVLVDGVTGDGTAAVMRRGLVAVGGCGAFAAASMIAGSLVVFGPIGQYPGANMKRGSIVAMGPSPELLPTFRYSCEFEPPFLELYLRRLRELNYPTAACKLTRSWQRYTGDLVSLGLGEILVRSER